MFFKFSNYLRYLGPLQLLSYALEIGLSIMELLWPEYLIMRTFQLHASALMLLPGKFYIIVLGHIHVCYC